MLIVHLLVTACFKHSAGHYPSVNHDVARKIASYVKQIPAPVVDLLLDSLILFNQCDFAEVVSDPTLLLGIS